MGVVLVLILIVVAIAAFFSLDFNSLGEKIPFLSRVSHYQSAALKLVSKHSNALNIGNKGIDLNSLNCRISPAQYNDGNSMCDAFAVEVCGSIHTPSNRHKTILKVDIFDITDGLQKMQSVQAKVKHWQKPGSKDLTFSSELGTLPNKVMVLSDWTNVAKIRLDWVLFPKMGKRKLKFNISIQSAENNKELASAECTYEHENLYFGYIDLQENIKRSKTLTVALAFSVISSGGTLNDEEIEYVKNWARENINTPQTPDSDRDRLEDALNETISFFKDGNSLDTCEICTEIADITPLAQKYDILEVCLNAIKLKNSQLAEEMRLLKNVVNWLEVSGEKFRIMVEKTIPLDMLDTTDMETILGVTSDMSGEKAREHLNREYAKWNSRVTNSDPKIQSQADQMLRLIAEARTQYAKSES